MRFTTRPGRTCPRRNHQTGGAVVEFAIVLPLFFALLFGTIDYGWYLFQKFTLASAVQTGLRAALSVKEADSPGPWQTAETATKAALGTAGAIPPASVVCGPVVPTDQVTGVAPQRALTLSCSFTFIPLVGLVRMPSPTMTHTATMLLDAQNADI